MVKQVYHNQETSDFAKQMSSLGEYYKTQITDLEQAFVRRAADAIYVHFETHCVFPEEQITPKDYEALARSLAYEAADEFGKIVLTEEIMDKLKGIVDNSHGKLCVSSKGKLEEEK